MEDFVTYEQAVQLKQLGFDYRTNTYFWQSKTDFYWSDLNNWNQDHDYISAPTLAQAAKWLRTKGIHIEIVYEIGYKDNQHCDTWRTMIDKMALDEVEKLEEKFDSYEEALSAGIDKILILLKENNMENKHNKTGIELIAEERQRQIEGEGFTPEHDKQWKHGELAEAAACYAAWLDRPSTDIEAVWPFDMFWWKPSQDRIRELQKAGALIAAEIDRLLTQQSNGNQNEI